MQYNNVKILIVDDELSLRTGTKRYLESEGFIVEEAENGLKGIKLGTEKDFDIAIIDLKMPDIDGMQVLKEITAVHPNTVCLISTAYASYETAIEATKLGAFTYLLKPFTPEELVYNLQKGIKKREESLERELWLKEREERLLEIAFEKTRLNTIINSITEGVFVVNKKGEAVLYNPSALKYLRVDKINIEENIIDKLHPEIRGLIDKVMANGKSGSFSSKYEADTKEKLFIEATSSPVPHHDGTLAGVVVVLKDITELKKIEIIKSQFISMVSHELKAPIAAVYGYLNILNDKKISVTKEQKNNFIHRSLFRLDSLLKMVNDLLDISRLELQTFKREIKPLFIPNILNSIVELFQIQLDENNIKAVFDHDENLPLCYADQEEMNRLFTNLISNAIKYNKNGGKIIITTRSTSHYIITEISDTGVGIDDKNKQRLFEEFFRVKNEQTKNVSGTGLGLSIVKRIIDNYSGKIEVDSKTGAGTSFKVSLPYINHIKSIKETEEIINS